MNSEYEAKKDVNRVKRSAYMIAIITNNFFANLTFILLSFLTEYNLMWFLVSVVFVLISFTPIGAGDSEETTSTRSSYKMNSSIKIYSIFLISLTILYIVISLLVNNSSWFFIMVIFIMNSIYLYNYNKDVS